MEYSKEHLDSRLLTFIQNNLYWDLTVPRGLFANSSAFRNRHKTSAIAKLRAF